GRPIGSTGPSRSLRTSRGRHECPPGAGVWRRELRRRVGRVRGGSHRSPASVRLRGQEAGPIHDGCIRTARAAPRGSAHTINPGSAFVTKLSAIVPLLLAVAGSLVYHASAK